MRSRAFLTDREGRSAEPRWFAMRRRSSSARRDPLLGAIRRGCARPGLEVDAVARIQSVIEQLAMMPESPAHALDVVSVSAFVDSVVVIVRDPSDRRDELDPRRQRMLSDHTAVWSTVTSSDGRTFCFEITRQLAPRHEADRPATADPATTEHECQLLRSLAPDAVTRAEV